VRRSRGGFTLAELLVAMVLGSFVMIIVFQMMSSQSRVVAAQSAREEAQQNVRGALEVLGSELRGAIPASITSAEAQALSFRQPRMWGLVCAAAGNTVSAFFPSGGIVDLAIGEGTGVMFSQSGIGITPVVWAPAGGVGITGFQAAPAGTCNGQGADGNFVVMNITGPGIAASARMDLPVVLYTMTRYEVAQAEGAWWLMRSNGQQGGAFVPQPLAGPVEPAKVTFTYYGANGGVLTPAAATASPANINMVRVQVVTNSTQKLDNRSQRDSGAVTIMLRNSL
jgi:prepilin-type N-terminal cleavage/methylation domain-containing protein